MTSTKQYTSLELANTFIERHGAGRGIDHLKLQKLCYLTYGHWLAHHGTPLLSDAPEVWKYGPVFSKLYRAMRGFGGRRIKAPIVDLFFRKEPTDD
jgi:uncharacterized phage-associated protein